MHRSPLSWHLTLGPFNSSAQPTEPHCLPLHPHMPRPFLFLKPYSSSAHVMTSPVSQHQFWLKVGPGSQDKHTALSLSPLFCAGEPSRPTLSCLWSCSVSWKGRAGCVRGACHGVCGTKEKGLLWSAVLGVHSARDGNQQWVCSAGQGGGGGGTYGPWSLSSATSKFNSLWLVPLFTRRVKARAQGPLSSHTAHLGPGHATHIRFPDPPRMLPLLLSLGRASPSAWDALCCHQSPLLGWLSNILQASPNGTLPSRTFSDSPVTLFVWHWPPFVIFYFRTVI